MVGSPRLPADNRKPYSPVYHSPTHIGKSPAYSPSGIGGRVTAPSPMNPNHSPAYSPSSLVGPNGQTGGSSYMKMMPQSPAMAGRSPHYPGGHINSPDAVNSERNNHLLNPARNVSPSPAYNPISPQFPPGGLSPAHTPSSMANKYIHPSRANPDSPNNAAYQPSSPNYQANKK